MIEAPTLRREPSIYRLDRHAILAIGFSLIAGVAMGVSTFFLQRWLPNDWLTLANSGAVWVVGAFIVGALLMTRRFLSAAAGTCVLIGAVVGYYGTAELLLSGRETLAGPVAWLVVACVAGPIYGIAGSWWRTSDWVRRTVAIGVLGAVFLGEGYRLLFLLNLEPAGIAFLCIGAGVPLILGRSLRERILGLAAATLFLTPLILVYELIDRALAGGWSQI